MTNQVIAADPFSKIWNFFTSVKLTIVLLLSLATTSIIGTLIPQNEDPQDYFQAFGGVFYQLFNLLDLFDMYHSWWFQLLIVSLTLNIIDLTDRPPIGIFNCRHPWHTDLPVKLRRHG